MSLSKRLLGACASLGCGLALAQALPPEVITALVRAKVPLDAITLLVVDAGGKLPPRLSHRAHVPVNPASVMKLVTTYAALDLLGPAYTWRTPVFVDGVVRDGTLFGNLYIKGQGDPKLVIERLWLLLRRVQGLGIQSIVGDIVLDRSAFEAVVSDPGSFDGEPLRPYNTAPDALLLNFKSVVMTFVPHPSAHSAAVQFEPPLAGVQMQTSVPLIGDVETACGDYRATLQPDFSDATRIRFDGAYPASCLERVWSVAYVDPASYGVRAVAGLWRELGGKLSGTVREGRVPERAESPFDARPSTIFAPAFEMRSPALAEIIRDVNKYSNNVMAQQLFLTLSLPTPVPNGNGDLVATGPAASLTASREVVRRWWVERIAPDGAPLLENGSGLSRVDRISAQALARLLQTAYRSPWMSELMSSLPIAGVDGTLKKRRTLAQSGAHLKTGSLRDVSAIAGYVDGASGQRYVLVAIANHPNAYAAHPAMEALIEWTASEQ